VPEQLLLSYTSNATLPVTLPPAGALIVAESFGMNDCADVIDEARVVTITSSLASVQFPLNVEPTLFRSPVAGV
jgi:hypothetical protein